MAFIAQAEITDSIAYAGVEPETDSVADSLSAGGMELHYGIQVWHPEVPAYVAAHPAGEGISWIIGALFVVLLIVCLRYRKNTRYFSLLLNDILEVRERHNAFDDTLREMSFVWLLNLLWCASAGVLLCGFIEGGYVADVSPLKLLICMATVAAYTLFMAGSYGSVGALFSSGGKASMWVKGYLSTQGLQTVALFPAAITGLCMPSLMGAMCVIGIIIFILAKFLFVYKSFCIFFTEFATWVLFLYYLCSLEIVPVVLTYAGALYFCGIV